MKNHRFGADSGPDLGVDLSRVCICSLMQLDFDGGFHGGLPHPKRPTKAFTMVPHQRTALATGSPPQPHISPESPGEDTYCQFPTEIRGFRTDSGQDPKGPYLFV